MEIENNRKMSSKHKDWKGRTEQSLFIGDIIASIEKAKESANIELLFFQFAISANRNMFNAMFFIKPIKVNLVHTEF